jgi:hypothetical protein
MHPTNHAERERLKYKKSERKKTKDPAGHVWHRRKVEEAKIKETEDELHAAKNSEGLEY